MTTEYYPPDCAGLSLDASASDTVASHTKSDGALQNKRARKNPAPYPPHRAFPQAHSFHLLHISQYQTASFQYPRSPGTEVYLNTPPVRICHLYSFFKQPQTVAVIGTGTLILFTRQPAELCSSTALADRVQHCSCACARSSQLLKFRNLYTKNTFCPAFQKKRRIAYARHAQLFRPHRHATRHATHPIMSTLIIFV